MAIFGRQLLLVLGVASALGLGACGGGGDPGGSNTDATPAMESSLAQTGGPSFSGEGRQDFQQAEPNALPEPEALVTDTAQGPDPSASVLRLAPGTMKWNPGHYVVFDADVGDYVIDTGLSEIRSLPFVKGIVLRAYWTQLEPEKDVYRFWRIDRYMVRAAAQHKRVFLLLGIRGFSLGRVAPAYLRTPYYGGGVYRFEIARGGFGENLRLWNDRTRNRLILLIQALARRYNDNPFFEGVILAETAFGKPVDAITEAQKAGYYAGLAQVDTAARRAFQNTVVIQFVNFPVDYTPRIVANLLDRGIGFGSPDIFIDDPQHEKYIYPFNDQAQGKVPIGMQVEHHSYLLRYIGGPVDPPPVHEIYVFARDRLHSNYMFWERDLYEPYRAWTRVLRMFRSASFPDTPSGGLGARCPAMYARCVRQAP